LLTGCSAVGVDAHGQTGGRRTFHEQVAGQNDTESFFELGDKLHGGQGVASELEEVVVQLDPLDSKDLGHEAHNRGFGRGDGWAVGRGFSGFIFNLETALSREPDTVHLKIGQEGGKAAMVLDHPKERNWQLTTFEPRPGYVATLALQTEKRLDIRQFSWSDQQETGSMGR
jgi:hypothetical protein